MAAALESEAHAVNHSSTVAFLTPVVLYSFYTVFVFLYVRTLQHACCVLWFCILCAPVKQLITLVFKGAIEMKFTYLQRD